jgi:hypothetical protein
MNAIKVDEAHRIQLSVLRPGDLYQPEVHGPEADEITLRRLKPATQRKMTKAEALKLTAPQCASAGHGMNYARRPASLDPVRPWRLLRALCVSAIEFQ